MAWIIVTIRTHQRERIKRCRFMVSGIAVVESLHCLEVLLTSFLVFLVRVSIKRTNCCDVVPFPCRLSVERHSNFDLVPTPLKLFSIRHPPTIERLRYSPVSHSTLRISFRNLSEGSLCCFKCEGMQ